MSINIGRFSEAPGPVAEEPAATAREDQKPRELVYGSAEEFLHEQLLPTYVRDLDGRAARWCIESYFHPEAVSRIEALWRAWEHLRLDGATGISVWWRDHADHHMNVLLDARPVLQMRHAKTPGPRTPRATTRTGRMVP
ncbi:NADH:ubiquinone oxidoreductase subunit [Arthrobacter globiformis]|nr:NADH:ubiquinone oxidoreductase subunit [Arthrobacter globiformis]